MGHTLNNARPFGGGIRQNFGNMFDAGLFLVLHLPRRIIAGVFLQVAFLTPLVDFCRHHRAVRNQGIELFLQLSLAFRGDILLLILHHNMLLYLKTRGLIAYRRRILPQPVTAAGALPAGRRQGTNLLLGLV